MRSLTTPYARPCSWWFSDFPVYTVKSRVYPVESEITHNLNPHLTGLLRMYCTKWDLDLLLTILSSIERVFTGWYNSRHLFFIKLKKGESFHNLSLPAVSSSSGVTKCKNDPISSKRWQVSRSHGLISTWAFAVLHALQWFLTPWMPNNSSAPRKAFNSGTVIGLLLKSLYCCGFDIFQSSA